jgi:hypothetical protein
MITISARKARLVIVETMATTLGWPFKKLRIQIKEKPYRANEILNLIGLSQIGTPKRVRWSISSPVIQAPMENIIINPNSVSNRLALKDSLRSSRRQKRLLVAGFSFTGSTVLAGLVSNIIFNPFQILGTKNHHFIKAWPEN